MLKDLPNLLLVILLVTGPLTEPEALAIYNSKTYEKLINVDNGLFIQSPLYIYEYLKKEINTSC